MLAYLAQWVPAGPGPSDVAFVARGDPDWARPHLDDALNAYGELGMETWAARASAPA
jgi:hypothetical protein